MIVADVGVDGAMRNWALSNACWTGNGVGGFGAVGYLPQAPSRLSPLNMPSPSPSVRKSLLSGEGCLLLASALRRGKNRSIGGIDGFGLSRRRPGGELSRDDALENERMLGGGVGSAEGRKNSALSDFGGGATVSVGVASDSDKGGTAGGTSVSCSCNRERVGCCDEW